MDFKRARGTLKRYDLRIYKKTKSVNGVVIGQENGRWVMTVLVTKKRRSHRWLEKLTLEGLPVKIKQVGKIRAVKSRTSKWRPAPGGVSIGHPNITAGTLGCTVFKKGQKYILSNNHILADTNSGGIGDPIYQPGPIDGGTAEDEIGELRDYIPLIFNDFNNPNYVDAALCKPNDESDVLDYLLELNYPNGVKEAEIGEQVTKSGRTTGVNESTITGFSGLIEVFYDAMTIGFFDDQIVTGVMHGGGDSGSLLVDKNTKEAVGLLFAGSYSLTLHSRATRIAEVLGIEFLGEPKVKLEAEYDILPLEASIRFYRCASWGEGDTHGGDIDLQHEIISGVDPGVFDDITNAERVGGDVEYRKIYVKNENIGEGSSWEDIRIWIASFTPAENDEIWITTQGTDSDTQVVAKNYAYYQPDSNVHQDAQDIGTLAAGEYQHIWIKRQVVAAGPSYSRDGFTLAFGRLLSSSSESSSSSSVSSSSSASSSSASSTSLSSSSTSTSSSSTSFSSSSSCSSSESSSSFAPSDSIDQGAQQGLEQGAWQTPAIKSSSSSSSSFSSASSSSSSSSSASRSSSSLSFSSSSSSSSLSFSSSSSGSSYSSSAYPEGVNRGAGQELERGAWQQGP